MTRDSNIDPRGLVGLQNLGNTCYMNGALQALSNCQQLTRFILDCPGFMRDSGLCRSYSDLIQEIWGDSQTTNNRSSTLYAVPTSIIRNIKCVYPAFRGCSQQDTQEFLRCFLEQLHDELKQPVRRARLPPPLRPILANHHQNNQKEGTQNLEDADDDDYEDDADADAGDAGDAGDDGDDDSEEDDEHDKSNDDNLISVNNTDNAIETTQQPTIVPPEAQSENIDKNSKSINSNTTNSDTNNDTSRSIISDIFEFKISSSVVCSNCNNISTTKETFKDLSIPIPTRDHPYYQMQEVSWDVQPSYLGSFFFVNWFWSWLSNVRNWFWGPQVTLQDCLSIFFETDPLEGDNEYSCDVCTKKNRGVKYLKILALPEVLCIHFKRYESIGSAKITTHVSFPLTGLDLAPYMSEDSKPQCTTYNLIACICHHGSALLNGHYTTYALNCYDNQWYEFDDQYVTSVQSYQVENSEAYILFYQKSTLDDRTERQRVRASRLLKKSLAESNKRKYFISKQWVNKFNTFVEPGPITNYDFLCEHGKIPQSRQQNISELCHPISEKVWRYLKKLHGGGPECKELLECDSCE